VFERKEEAMPSSREWTPLEPGDLPDDHLVLPALPKQPDERLPQLALYVAAEGDLVAVAFTSVDRLLASFGPGTTWVALSKEAVPKLLEGSGARRILVDPDINLQETGPMPES
jgi:hypothetical protein